MIRLTLLWLLVSYLCVYAWKDWYKSLCWLIALIAVVEHPDFPKGMFGVQGFNPWNVLMLCVILAWAKARRVEGLVWDLQPAYKFAFTLFVLTMMISLSRLLSDIEGFTSWSIVTRTDLPSLSSLVSEKFINRVKWLVPAILVYDGCRSRERVQWTLLAILFMYFGLAIQIVKWMPLSTITSGGELSDRSLKILLTEIGFHRVNLAMMMAGLFWAIVATVSYWDKGWQRAAARACAAIAFLALAMTGGRTGYATWALVGFVFAFIKWRRYFMIGPLVVLIAFTVIPGASERLLQGFGEESEMMNQPDSAFQSETANLYEVTSGRNIAWPLVLDEMAEGPIIGFGEDAMIRRGLSTFLLVNYSESFPHPHSAYLQWALDNGLVGVIPLLILFIALLRNSLRHLKLSNDKEMVVVGGVSASLLLALLFASVGSQTFYPREGAVALWASVGLLLRAMTYSSRHEGFPAKLQVTRERRVQSFAT